MTLKTCTFLRSSPLSSYRMTLKTCTFLGSSPLSSYRMTLKTCTFLGSSPLSSYRMTLKTTMVKNNEKWNGELIHPTSVSRLSYVQCSEESLKEPFTLAWLLRRKRKESGTGIPSLTFMVVFPTLWVTCLILALCCHNVSESNGETGLIVSSSLEWRWQAYDVRLIVNLSFEQRWKALCLTFVLLAVWIKSILCSWKLKKSTRS